MAKEKLIAIGLALCPHVVLLVVTDLFNFCVCIAR